MKMIVALGNPGRCYSKTRHNIGFMTINRFVEEKKIKICKKKFNGLFEIIEVNNEKAILLKPQVFMNLSGQVVKAFVDYYKINIADILVISDDLDLPTGFVRLKPRGSSGGHNGLKNIEESLQSKEYKRLRIGISNNKSINSKEYVLGKISKEEFFLFEKMFLVTNNILNDFFYFNFDNLMNKYN